MHCTQNYILKTIKAIFLGNINIPQLAKKALSIEIRELEKAKERLDKNFSDAVEKIYSATGKLVVVGVGKSAHIAAKMVATFNSTGTPAQFLHATEAIHGDLGLLHKDDVVICISNSGNSQEIAILAPILRERAQCLIAMTGNLKSKLAENADIIIDTHVDEEACPNQLAPTSSTTVQMAIGDAMAVCLMELNNFGQNDFAKNHPGGTLGKNLLATVGQFLSAQKPEISQNANIREIIISISASKHGITVITDHEEILGVITDGDLRRMLLNNEHVSHIIAKDIMSTHPKTVEKTALAKDAMEILKKNNIGQLIVTEDGKYRGIIDIHTLLDEGIN